MRLNCPLCGARDSREFAYRGSASLMARPLAVAGEAAFVDYVNTRENKAGETEELWHHVFGCSAWLHVRRNTVTHEMVSVELVKDVLR